MQSSVLVVKRGLRIPKQDWRDPSCNRTLAAIDLDAMLTGLWRAHRYDLGERGVLEASLELDGSPQDVPVTRSIQEGQKGFAGIFDFMYATTEEVRVTLRGERCWSHLGTPRRRTHLIALLRPWKPVRVLLNGRSSSYAGQYYSVWEYHLLLCAGPAPDELTPARFIDLQADLM